MKRILFACILVSACGPTEVPNDVEVADDGPVIDLAMCKMQDLADSVGQPVDSVRALLPEGTRVQSPDSVVTQDYRPTRANVFINQAGIITRISCG
ncbi:Peptidase inhibitor I78 family protein [Falsiruegeria litorea R37]|uniref:Peptidase inhibitor I78 family protein n=1 Tax=Falsiruegeria litorea R37 TaxID=1200284 RepID=A0A1Y5TFI1_9RHOB|nr:I78 family peptidase inhibitor [Falsiruegeria litorea]SLN62692.1 Peptidase inhibitor I78 family protein [Falsiruegeria litorea R37]